MANVQDLNQLGTPAGDPATPSTSKFVEKPYDPAPDRENVRGTIALALVSTLVGVIGVVVLAGLLIETACYSKDACTPETIELKTISKMLELILTPLIGLVGAVTGFYFGEKSATGSSK
jgi:hypothetical protein